MHLVGRGGRGGWALSPLSGPDQGEPQGTASASSGCAPAAEGTPPAARGLRNEGPKLRSSASRREPGRGGTGPGPTQVVGKQGFRRLPVCTKEPRNFISPTSRDERL